MPWDLGSRVKTSDMLCAVMTSVMNWYMFFLYELSKIFKNSWIKDAQRLMSC